MAQVLACANAYTHACEVLQGAVWRSDGVHRLLYSLRALTLWTKVELISTPGQGLSVNPPDATKTLFAVHLLLNCLGLPEPDVEIRLITNIPCGKGMGSSSCDILAALRAIISLLHIQIPEETLAKLIVEAEEASDSSILSREAIFRHREGRVEEYLEGTPPIVHIVVIDTLPESCVLTNSMQRARYSEEQLRTYDVLIARLRRAFRNSDAKDFGAVATASARISQQFLPKPHLEDLIKLAHDVNGHGVAVAHSGTVVAMILPPQCDPAALDRIYGAVCQYGMKVVTEYDLGSVAQLEVAA
jgi:uncharacterized protein involved in propanediol utilization